MKVGMTDDFFGKLWKKAEEHIQEAREVYIVGCRLAEGDAKARDTILDAMKRNPDTCQAHLVLGTDTNSGDVRRLESLLDGLIKHKHGIPPIVTHPLWAEDFLSKWARAQSTLS